MNESAALGDVRKVRLEQGSIRYREVGGGEPILFVPGILTNGVPMACCGGTSLRVRRDVSVA